MKRLITQLLLGAAFGAVASASPLDPGTLLASYNLITVGNATSNGDIEGAMLVGGNFTGAAGTANLFNNSAHLPAAKTSYVYGNNSSNINLDNGGSLYVGGNNSGNLNSNGGGNGIQIVGANNGGINGASGGFVAVGGANSGTINFNGAANMLGNSMAIVPAHSISDVVSALSGYSADLSALTANGTVSKVGSTVNFSYGGTGQAVFALTASDLTTMVANANLDFLIADASAPVVVNVDLQGGGWSEPSSTHFVSGSPLQNVLFNFYNGSGPIDFSTLWETSILAMGSAVTNHTPIEGSLAAYSFTGYGELHNYPLQTPPDGGGNNNPPPAIPEPTPLSLMIVALLGVAWMGRKRLAP